MTEGSPIRSGSSWSRDRRPSGRVARWEHRPLGVAGPRRSVLDRRERDRRGLGPPRQLPASRQPAAARSARRADGPFRSRALTGGRAVRPDARRSQLLAGASGCRASPTSRRPGARRPGLLSPHADPLPRRLVAGWRSRSASRRPRVWLLPFAVAPSSSSPPGCRPSAWLPGLVFGAAFQFTLLWWMHVVGHRAWLGLSRVPDRLVRRAGGGRRAAAPSPGRAGLAARSPGWRWRTSAATGRPAACPGAGWPSPSSTPRSPARCPTSAPPASASCSPCSARCSPAAYRRAARRAGCAPSWRRGGVAARGRRAAWLCAVRRRPATAHVDGGGGPGQRARATGPTSSPTTARSPTTTWTRPRGSPPTSPPGGPRSPDFVVWPENSTAIDPFEDPEMHADIEAAVDGRSACRILVGVVVDGGPEHVLNQGIVFDPVTGAGDRYTKWHPVPFGEYIPWRWLLRHATSPSSTRSRATWCAAPGSTPLRRRPALQVADAICFDVAYDDGLYAQLSPRRPARRRADQQRDVHPHRPDRPAVRDQPAAGDRDPPLRRGGGHQRPHRRDRPRRLAWSTSTPPRTHVVRRGQVGLYDAVTPAVRIGPWVGRARVGLVVGWGCCWASASIVGAADPPPCRRRVRPTDRTLV